MVRLCVDLDRALNSSLSNILARFHLLRLLLSSISPAPPPLPPPPQLRIEAQTDKHCG